MGAQCGGGAGMGAQCGGGAGMGVQCGGGAGLGAQCGGGAGMGAQCGGGAGLGAQCGGGAGMGAQCGGGAGMGAQCGGGAGMGAQCGGGAGMGAQCGAGAGMGAQCGGGAGMGAQCGGGAGMGAQCGVVLGGWGWDGCTCGWSDRYIPLTRDLCFFNIVPPEFRDNTMFVDGSNVRLLLVMDPSVVPITVHLMECPLGFPLSPTQGKCQCDSHYDVECNINNNSFWRSANSRTWIGFINKSSNASCKPGVMYHPNCPIGYCSRRDVNITNNTSDDQCEPHRTGLLCGECEEGYSLTLGDEKCAQCSNTHLLLILPFIKISSVRAVLGGHSLCSQPNCD